MPAPTAVRKWAQRDVTEVWQHTQQSLRQRLIADITGHQTALLIEGVSSEERV